MYDRRIITIVTSLMSFLMTQVKGFDNQERPHHFPGQHYQAHIQKETSFLHTQGEIFSTHNIPRRLKKINVDDDYLEESDDGDNDIDDDFGESIDKLEKTYDGRTCIPISVCELCHGGKRGGHDGCSATGKRVKSKCIVPDGGGYKIDIEYRPCYRTPMDEEYVMIQFQAICLFVAFFSLRAVRREKIISASLFELRTRRKLRQEMVPLTPKDSGLGLDGKGIDNAV